MALINAFHDTKNLYREYVQYEKPLTFDEWVKLPNHKKAALLYVQFYPEITLAWNKANSINFGAPEDGVSTVCQYLEKNVAKIEEDPNKFNPAYIYRVAYNCMYCICGHDRKRDKDIIEYETAGIIMSDGKELNLLELSPDQKGSAEDQLRAGTFEWEFWKVIEDEGLPAEKVMRYLTTGDITDLKKLNRRNKRYSEDPLSEIEVSIEEVEKIVEKLRQKFLSIPADSECGRYISSFKCVLES